MDKVKQVVDKIVHPGKDHSSTTGTTTHSTHTDPTFAGNHTAGHSTGVTGHSTGVTGSSINHGPHGSPMANKMDPTVDSNLDGSRNLGAAQHGLGGVHNQHSSGLPGTTATGTHGHSATGPHGSNLANKLDPRVSDSTGSGLTGGYGSTASTNAGPHNSNAMNSVDPRVDSDRDGSHNLGAAQYGPGGAHNQHGSGLVGNTHGSGLTGNTTGSGLTGSNHGTHGPVTGNLTGGPAPRTAGPHKNDTLNKLDPRVDSDRDGSKTIGQAPTPQY